MLGCLPLALEDDLPDFDRPSWDDIWFQMSEVIATRSLCSRAQVGCVIVADDQTVLSASYNGTAPLMEVSGPCTGWCGRARGEGELDAGYALCPAVHAESNGIARLDRSRVRGATAYVNRSVCHTCAKLIAAAGISRVVHRVTEDDLHRDPDGVEEFLRQCGVSVERWSN